MRHTRRVSSLALTLALAGLGACAGQRPEGSPFEAGREGTVLLTVDNQDFRDATIFADWNGVRHRVGMVIGKTRETFRLGWRDYTVRLEVDFVGGGELKIGDEILVSPGEHIDFIIMPGW